MVGERIKQARLSIGYSAEQVAAFLGVAPATVYRYENGDISKLPAKFIRPLAEYLCVSPAYLMGWTEESEIMHQERLSKDEHQLITIYQSLSSEGKKQVLYQAHVAQLAFGEKSSPVPAAGSDAV